METMFWGWCWLITSWFSSFYMSLKNLLSTFDNFLFLYRCLEKRNVNSSHLESLDMVWLLVQEHSVHQSVCQLHSRTLHRAVARIYPGLSGMCHFYLRTHHTHQQVALSSVLNHIRVVDTIHPRKCPVTRHCIVFHPQPCFVRGLSNAHVCFPGDNAEHTAR